MMQVFRAVPIRAASIVGVAVPVANVQRPTSVALEIDFDFKWILHHGER